MMTVEIRWKVESGGEGEEWHGWERTYDTRDDLEAMERAFDEWLDAKVRGRYLVLRELEFHVDGEYQQWREGEYARWMQRATEAMG